ncbi:MAG: hypothetical protein AAGK32_02275 [Actinomycetota bacterium]
MATSTFLGAIYSLGVGSLSVLMAEVGLRDLSPNGELTARGELTMVVLPVGVVVLTLGLLAVAAVLARNMAAGGLTVGLSAMIAAGFHLAFGAWIAHGLASGHFIDTHAPTAAMSAYLLAVGVAALVLATRQASDGRG